MAIFPQKLGDTAVRVIAQNPTITPDVVNSAGGGPLDYLGQGFQKFVPTPVSFPRVQNPTRIPQSAVDPSAAIDSVVEAKNGNPKALSEPVVQLMSKLEDQGKDPEAALAGHDTGDAWKGVKLTPNGINPGQEGDDLDAQNRTDDGVKPTPDDAGSGKASLEVALPANIPAPDISGTGYDAAGIEKKRAELVAQESKDIAQAAQEHTKAVQMQIDAVAQAQREHDMQRQKEVESQQAQEKTISGIMDKQQSLMADVAKLAATGIDPNHYWADKNAGQRVAGGIAAFLFGLAGKGMDYLNQINEEVNRDIRVQQMNYENKSKALDKQIEGNQAIYSMARQKGLDAASAAAAARAGILQSYALHLENAKLSGENAEAASRAALAIDALKNKALAASEDVAKTAATLGMQQKALVEKQWEAKVENERERYKIQVAAAAKGAAEKEPPATLKKSVAESLEAIQSTNNALSAIPEGAGSWLYDKVSGVSPGTDSNVADKAFVGVREKAIKSGNGGDRVSDADMVRLSPGYPQRMDVGARRVWQDIKEQKLLDFYKQVEAFNDGIPEKKQFKALPEYKEAEALFKSKYGVKGEKER